MQGRTLPGLPRFAEDVARALQGTARILFRGDYPSAAIAFGTLHPLLVRDHGHSLALSLPLDGSWIVRTSDDFTLVAPAIRARLLGAAHPFSIADAVVALQPLLAGFADRAWALGFPGVPVPSEAWLTEGAQSIGLFQRTGGVTIMVWAGASLRQKAVRTHSEVEGIASWLEGALREQDLAREADVAEKRLEAALPPPDADEVLSRLRAGARIRTGGGRFYREFFWDTRLRCEIFDEGSSDLVDATEDDLQAQIRNSPEAFRRALEKK